MNIKIHSLLSNKLIVKCLLVLLLSLVLLNTYTVYEKKDGLFSDEIYTFILANFGDERFSDYLSCLWNCGPVDCYEGYEQNHPAKFLKGENLIEKCYVPQGRGVNLFNTYVQKTLGDQHPPLYYFVLHTVSALSHSANLKLLGYSINVFFLIIMCVLMFSVTNMICKNDWLSLLTVAFYGFSYACTNSVTYCRMYVMESCLLMAVLYMYLRFEKNKWNVSKREIILLVILSFVAMLTHYFAAFFLAVIFVIAVKRLGNNTSLRRFFVKSYVIMGVIYLIIWPQSLISTCLSIGMKLEMDSPSFLSRLHYGGQILYGSYLSGNWHVMVPFLVLVLLAALLYWKNKSMKDIYDQIISSEDFYKYLMLILPASIYYIIVVLISPWLAFRYLSPVLPVLSIVFFLFVERILYVFWQNDKVRYSVLAAFTIIISVFFVPQKHLDFLFELSPGKYKFLDTAKDTPAIIVDGYDFWNMELFLNDKLHSSYTSIAMREISQYIDKEDVYLVYYDCFKPQNSIEEALNGLSAYSFEKLQYKTTCYFIYVLRKIENN